MQESDMQVVVTTCMLAANEKRMLLTKQGFTEVNGLPDINDCVAQMQGEFNYVDESTREPKSGATMTMRLWSSGMRNGPTG